MQVDPGAARASRALSDDGDPLVAEPPGEYPDEVEELLEELGLEGYYQPVVDACGGEVGAH